MTEPAARKETRYDVPLTVNGAYRSAHVTARRTLSDYLRHDLGLTEHMSAANTGSVVPARCCSTTRRSAPA